MEKFCYMNMQLVLTQLVSGGTKCSIMKFNVTELPFLLSKFISLNL